MICPACKGEAVVVSLKDGHLSTKALHSGCPGGTWCDCQHQTGVFINPQPGVRK